MKSDFIFLLKNFAKNTINNFLFKKIFLKILIKNLLAKPYPIILMFHMITPQDEEDLSSINNLKLSPQFFEYVIKTAIVQNRYFISLDELWEILIHNKKLDKKATLITFDDGYRDNFLYAYPILKKYDIPFTIYINSGFINKEFFPWWLIIADLIKKKDTIFWENKKFNIDSKLKKEKFYFLIRNKLINCNSKEKIEKIVNMICEENKCSIKKNNLFMSWKEIKELLNYPKFCLGTHTYFHLNLTVLNEEQIQQEIERDIKEIKKNTGIEPKHISYPFGFYNKKVISVVKCFSLYTGVSTKLNFVFNKNNILELPRVFLREKVTGLLRNLI